MTTHIDLSETEQRVLDAYIAMTAAGRCPFQRDVAAHVGLSVPHTSIVVSSLVRKGYAARRPGRRNVILTDKA